MIGQKAKPVEEILRKVEGKERLVLIGCGGCATVFRTGGKAEVSRMAAVLAEKGKEVLAAVSPGINEFICYAPTTKSLLERHREELKGCDAVLVLACGDGAQVVREVMEALGIVKPIYPGVDTLGLMGGGPAVFEEACQQCGDCVIDRFAGICPLTRCPKGILNGPCGGVRGDGTCEVDPDRRCAWMEIYERLSLLGELERFGEFIPPKDRSAQLRPGKVEVGPRGPG
ncbi:methylenetetrahydrofolate reductase C-terminal domain-containing protein [Candidatus Bipolaricaulota sp. J31]